MGERRLVRSNQSLHHSDFGKSKNEYVVTLLNIGAPPSEAFKPRPAIGGPRVSTRRSLRQAPRFGRARASASPEIRVSRSGFRRRGKSLSPRAGKQKPSGASAREGLRQSRFRTCLCESAPMSRACVVDWLKAIRQPPQGFFADAKHCSTHVLHEHHVREGAVCTPTHFHRQALRVRINHDVSHACHAGNAGLTSPAAG